ncbi:MAG: hypothetical protein K1X56_08115 [Flavobacteriales bacterium]|nr:hypothetical protein [Flavobacteriales bacterium]
MKYLFLISYLFILSYVNGQNNCYDIYNSTQKPWIVKQFYSSDRKTLIQNDSCNLFSNGKPYRLSYLKNGYLYYEAYFDLSTNKKISEFIRYSENPGAQGKDTLYGIFTRMNPNGQPAERYIYYKNKSGQIVTRTSYFLPNGKTKSTTESCLKENAYSSCNCGENLSYDDNGKLIRKEIFSANNCSDEGEFSTVQEFYPNGKMLSQSQRNNGNLNGKYIQFYPNGRILKIEHYQNGTLIKDGIAYFEDGDTSEYFRYGEGFQRAGFEKHKNKKIKSEIRLNKEGNGVLRNWNENGDLISIIPYQNNRPGNPEFANFENGRKKIRTAFSNSDTTYASWDENGTLRCLKTTMIFKDTTRETEINFDEQGCPQQSHIKDYFSNRFIKTTEIKYYSCNSIREIRTSIFQNPVQIEIKNFHKNGELQRSYQLKNYKIDGAYLEYSSEGKIVKQFHYKDGLRNGECRQYEKEVIILEKNYPITSPDFNFKELTQREKAVYEQAKKILYSRLSNFSQNRDTNNIPPLVIPQKNIYAISKTISACEQFILKDSLCIPLIETEFDPYFHYILEMDLTIPSNEIDSLLKHLEFEIVMKTSSGNLNVFELKNKNCVDPGVFNFLQKEKARHCQLYFNLPVTNDFNFTYQISLNKENGVEILTASHFQHCAHDEYYNFTLVIYPDLEIEYQNQMEPQKTNLGFTRTIKW